MIFVILGSQKFQFNRLLKQVDVLVERGIIAGEVFAQTGCSDYRPAHFAYKPFLDRDEFDRMQANADIVITHGGTGAIIGALKKNKKVIAVARRACYGEHVDDHQSELLEQFEQMHLICVCKDTDNLAQALEQVRTTQYRAYKSNTGAIIASIEEFITTGEGK